MKLYTKNYFTFLLFLFFTANSFAQLTETISSITVGTARENQPLSFRVDLMQAANINSVVLFYRAFGQNEYDRQEMEIIGNSARYTIPSDKILPPFIEYAVVIESNGQVIDSYPIGFPNISPIQITIESTSPKDKEIIILTPDFNESVNIRELFISISLIRASDNVDKAKTRVFLNTTEITDKMLFADDLILFYAENFPNTVRPGNFILRVDLYDKNGNLYHTYSSGFSVFESGRFAFQESIGDFQYTSRITGETRNENISNVNTLYSRLNVNFNGKYDDWKVNGLMLLTSEERGGIQPQHRFNIGIENSWLDLKYGDNFPQFPNMIIDGKRVRGFLGSLKFGFVNLQTVFGEVNRAAEGKLLEVLSSNNVSLSSNIIEIDSAKYGGPFGRISQGTYSRKLFAIRPYFGTGENFQLGFSYLHSIDDKNSIEFSQRPQENLVVGSDLTIGVDERNVLFQAQSAISVSNTNIAPGSFTDAQIDSFVNSGGAGSSAEDLKKLRDILEKFITFNQFIKPLNPEKFATLSNEASLSLNYFNNFLKITYLYRGNDFQSFGQSFLRTDVKGFNINDRLRLMENKLFLSLGYESLSDNLQKTKLNTTKYQTLNTSISYFPRNYLPNVTVAFSRFANKNDAPDFIPGPTPPGSPPSLKVDDITNRILLNLSYDFEYYVKHNTSFTFANSDRKDKGPAQNDGTNNSITFTLNSTWDNNLSSSLSLTHNANKIGVSEFKYTSVYLGGRYRMLQGKLILSSSISPSFGDFERQSFDFSSQYYIMKNFSLALQFRYFRYTGFNNTIVGLTTQFDL